MPTAAAGNTKWIGNWWRSGNRNSGAKKDEVLCDSLDVLLVGSNSVVRQGASNRLRLHARTLARPRSYTCSCRSAQPRFLESAPYNFRTNTTSGKALLCIRVEKEKH